MYLLRKVNFLFFSFACLLLVEWLSPLGAQQREWLAGDRGDGRLPIVTPEDAGFDSLGLAEIEGLVESAMEAGDLPGGVVCLGRRGRIAYLQAFGDRTVEPEREPMTTDTVFDLASLTKPIATGTSIMQLVEQGRIRLDQPVAEILPEFGTRGKELITVRQLLTHESGLIPDNPLSDYQQGTEEAWRRIAGLAPIVPVGTEFKYSDVNFLVLGEIVKRITGMDLHEYTQRHVFGPLNMGDTGFNPTAARRLRAAPTEQRDGRWLRGEVHDPRAALLDGIAGHAGLFSTAEDLAVYADCLLQGGRSLQAENSVEILTLASVDRMTAPQTVSSGIRGLGWDKQTGFSSNKGDLLSAEAFGHGGFTGTVLWIDPKLDLFFIFLSSRLHPDGEGAVNRLAGKIANVAARSLKGSPDDTPKTLRGGPRFPLGEVETGLDVLQAEGFRRLIGKRVGVISNTTGRDRAGHNIVELLANAKGVSLVAVFSPEHGFEATLDIPNIDDSVEPNTGVPIYSLYGQTKRPTAEMLSSVDVLVFDIQDVGTRFYTYISTMGNAMQAAAAHETSFLVLDRPNPLGGERIEGPMLDPDFRSFVAFHDLPVRHGMTVGELALMFQQELDLELDLAVVPCKNWQRHHYWDQTGLSWTNPSPNMRSLTQAFLYPGMALWEFTNVSVGRGTDTPFEQIGAPWIDGRQLAAKLRELDLAGVTFVPVQFTPTSSKYAGETCRGVNVIVVDRDTFSSVECGMGIAHALRQLYPESWNRTSLQTLLGCQSLADAIEADASWAKLRQLATDRVESFRDRRKPFLLYD